MDKLNFQTKKAGDTLAASEWNQTVNKIDELVDASNAGGNTIPTEDIPGYTENDTVIGNSEDGNVLISPKGTDSQNHENKIIFKGVGQKEFGAFNSGDASIYTNRYRFNEDGIIYPVTRGVPVNTYNIEGDASSGIKDINYPTQSDGFKDIINNNKSCTWGDVVKVGSGFHNKGINIVNRDQLLTSESQYPNQNNSTLVSDGGGLKLTTEFLARPIYCSSTEEGLNTQINNHSNATEKQNMQNCGSVKNLPHDSDLYPNASGASILDYADFPNKKFTASEIKDIFATYSNSEYIAQELKNAYELTGYVKFKSSKGAYVIYKVSCPEIILGTGTIYKNFNDYDSSLVHVSDLVKLVNWMKTNQQGPWANS